MGTKKDIFIWSSDFENYTGEGLLARNFIEKFLSKSSNKIRIKSNNGEYLYYKKKIKVIKYSNYKNDFINKYFKLFWGILLLRWYNFNGYRTFYINYLPLWNFLIFLLLPKRTYLGPITGGTYINNNNKINYLIRKHIFPILFKISSKIINKKYNFLMFSTKMLKNFLNKKIIDKSIFDLNLICFKKNKKKQLKNIDYLFYYRDHSNKSNFVLKQIIFKLTQSKKVLIVGDKLIGKNIVNLGNISRSKLLNYLGRTKFSINSGENFYSLFALDCIAKDVSLFVNNNNYLKKNYFPSSYIKTIDFSDIKKSSTIILQTKKQLKRSKKYKLFKKKEHIIKIVNSKINIS